MGGLLGQRKATTLAFIMEAGEGPIGAPVAENGGAGALVDANPADPVSWFSRKAGPGTAGTAALLTSNRAPWEGGGVLRPGPAQPQKRGSAP